MGFLFVLFLTNLRGVLQGRAADVEGLGGEWDQGAWCERKKGPHSCSSQTARRSMFSSGRLFM